MNLDKIDMDEFFAQANKLAIHILDQIDEQEISPDVAGAGMSRVVCLLAIRGGLSKERLLFSISCGYDAAKGGAWG